MAFGLGNFPYIEGCPSLVRKLRVGVQLDPFGFVVDQNYGD
jgi:hypothetical protein